MDETGTDILVLQLILGEKIKDSEHSRLPKLASPVQVSFQPPDLPSGPTEKGADIEIVNSAPSTGH